MLGDQANGLLVNISIENLHYTRETNTLSCPFLTSLQTQSLSVPFLVKENFIRNNIFTSTISLSEDA